MLFGIAVSAVTPVHTVILAFSVIPALSVIPAQAGISPHIRNLRSNGEIPACAGMTC